MGFKTYPHRRPYDPEQKHIVNGVADNEWLNSHRPYLNVWSRQPQPYMYDQEKADWIPKSLEDRRHD